MLSPKPNCNHHTRGERVSDRVGVIERDKDREETTMLSKCNITTLSILVVKHRTDDTEVSME